MAQNPKNVTKETRLKDDGGGVLGMNPGSGMKSDDSDAHQDLYISHSEYLQIIC